MPSEKSLTLYFLPLLALLASAVRVQIPASYPLPSKVAGSGRLCMRPASPPGETEYRVCTSELECAAGHARRDGACSLPPLLKCFISVPLRSRSPRVCCAQRQTRRYRASSARACATENSKNPCHRYSVRTEFAVFGSRGLARPAAQDNTDRIRVVLARRLKPPQLEKRGRLQILC